MLKSDLETNSKFPPQIKIFINEITFDSSFIHEGHTHVSRALYL